MTLRIVVDKNTGFEIELKYCGRASLDSLKANPSPLLTCILNSAFQDEDL